MLDLSYRRPLLFALWAAGIFVTSCFYINSTTLYGVVRRLTNSEFTHHFARFWRGYGIFVVKGWHVTEYAVFDLLCFAALKRSTPDTRRAAAVALGSAVLFAISDEWHQTFVPNRDGCLRDVLIDSSGALVAAFWVCSRSGRPAIKGQSASTDS